MAQTKVFTASKKIIDEMSPDWRYWNDSSRDRFTTQLSLPPPPISLFLSLCVLHILLHYSSFFTIRLLTIAEQIGNNKLSCLLSNAS